MNTPQYPMPTGLPPQTTGIVIVDHGSRLAQSNLRLEQLVARFAARSGFQIVEPAHMELAEPSIATAFDRCAEQGARLIIVHPFFLLPGRHWSDDIPRLAAGAAARHPGMRFLVTAPLGQHEMILDVVQGTIEQCVAHTLAQGEPCDLCDGTEHCRVVPER